MWYKQAKKQHHTGAMVALYIPKSAGDKIYKATTKTNPQGRIEEQSEYHITLAYFPDAKALSKSKNNIMEILANFAKNRKPIKGKISGIGLFNNQESDGTRAFYASADCPELPAFRQELVEALNLVTGNAISDKHGFTPHITLAYLEDGADIPKLDLPPQSVSFDKLNLTWADARTDFEFNA
jgi:2'-5' RNA ligase